MTTMALSIICHTFIEASYMYTGTSGRAQNPYTSSKIAREAFAFIQGTGLEVTIQRFDLDLNADELREGFYAIFKRS